MENLDIFASNGFGLTVDEDAPYGQGEKIRLIAMPISKETTFDEKGQYRNRLASKGRKLMREKSLRSERAHLSPPRTIHRHNGPLQESAGDVCYASLS